MRLHELSDRRPRQRRGGEQFPACRLGQAADARARESSQARREGQERLACPTVAGLRDEFTRDLERVERIPAGRVHKPRQRGARQRRAEPGSDDVMDARKRKRPRLEPQHAIFGQGTCHTQGKLLASPRPTRQQQSQPGRQSTRRERQRLARGRVEPLHIVDRNEHRPLLRKSRENRKEAARRRPRQGSFIRVGAQERRRERALLHIRKLIAHLVERRSHKIRQRGVGERRLRLCGPCLQDAERVRLCGCDRLHPQGCLADPGLALDDQRRRSPRNTREETSDLTELMLTTNDQVRHYASMPRPPILRRSPSDRTAGNAY